MSDGMAALARASREPYELVLLTREDLEGLIERPSI